MISVTMPVDWKALRSNGLLTVLDPLTFRVAESFLRGAPDEGDEEMWSAISGNVAALTTFVDAVMMHDRLPVFDYGVTWEPELAGFATSLVGLCNQEEELLVDVRVDGEAYVAARAPAIRVLKHLPPVEPRLAADVKRELTLFDYRWRPQLEDLGTLDDDERTLASFRYGGLLFHYYAESMSDRRQPLDRRAEHVLHAKRADIMMATSLALKGQVRLDEQRILNALRQVERDTDGGIAAIDVQAPTFLPYLLAMGPRSPQDLLRLALRERRRGLVRSYREWRSGLLADLADGRVRAKTRHDLQAIAAEIQRKVKGNTMASLHLSYAADWKTLAGALTGNPLGLVMGMKLEGKINETALRFQLASILPGRGFRKLLTRLVAAQEEYFALDRALRDLWYRGDRRNWAAL